MCKNKNMINLECLTCEKLVFPNMPNGREDFIQLIDIVGLFEAIALNPDFYCEDKKGVFYE